MTLSFTFTAPLWEPPNEAPWVFMTLPKAAAAEIADEVPRRPGFGSIKVTATIGTTAWSTSLFPSKELSSYVLPVKRAVRSREGLEVGDAASVTIRIESDVGGEVRSGRRTRRPDQSVAT
jgi:hypothetical protein